MSRAGKSLWGSSVFSSTQLCPCGQWQNLEQSLANGQDGTLRNNSQPLSSCMWLNEAPDFLHLPPASQQLFQIPQQRGREEEPHGRVAVSQHLHMLAHTHTHECRIFNIFLLFLVLSYLRNEVAYFYLPLGQDRTTASIIVYASRSVILSLL